MVSDYLDFSNQSWVNGHDIACGREKDKWTAESQGNYDILTALSHHIRISEYVTCTHLSTLLGPTILELLVIIGNRRSYEIYRFVLTWPSTQPPCCTDCSPFPYSWLFLTPFFFYFPLFFFLVVLLPDKQGYCIV